MYWCRSAARARAEAVVSNGFSTATRADEVKIGLRQALDHRHKQGGQDLQIEHRVSETFDGISDALIRGRITEITLDVRTAASRTGRRHLRRASHQPR